jgi:antitoxin component of MazEF toxin-antitoxin module
MRTRLTRIGNELGLVLEPALLSSLGITAKTELEVSTDGTVIVISPRRSKRGRKRLKRVADEIFERYAGAFRKLAD